MTPTTLKLFGPPGTGKTTALLELFERAVEDHGPARVAFLTFTRAARLEASSRVLRSPEELPWVRTLHSACYKHLGLSAGRIVTAEALGVFGREVGLDLSTVPPAPWQEELYGWSEVKTADDRLLVYDHLRRQRRLSLASAAGDLPAEVTRKYWSWFVESYEAWKYREGLLDYTDLLEQARDAAPLPVKVLFVDEAQDLSPLQWEVVARLAAGCEQVVVAGDDDQAIFEWAGAAPYGLVDLPADKERVLSQSYRLPVEVQSFAQVIARRIRRRKAKDYRPRPGAGEVVHDVVTPAVERNERTFVLYRNHVRAADLAEQLRRDGVPFTGPGAPLDTFAPWLRTYAALCQGQLVKREAALKLARFTSPLLQVSMLDVFGSPHVWESWPALFRAYPQVAYLRAVERKHGKPALLDPPVRLMSIHQAKGREADVVVVDPTMTKRTWQSYLRDPDAEHRVFYVAATRAKRKLVLLAPAGSHAYGW